MEVKCEESYILSHISYEKDEFFIECKAPIALRILGNSISTDIKTLINSGNLEEAIRRLGGDVTKSTDLVETFNTKISIDIEDLYAEKRYLNDITNISEEVRNRKKEVIDKKIDSLKTQLDSVQKRIEEVGSGTCVVCFSEYENPVMLKCCKNILCFECLSGCLQNKQKCPYCREIMDYSNTILISEKEEADVVPKEVLKDKIENLYELILKNPQKKILLFSTSDFEKIVRYLSRKRLNFTEVAGGREVTDRIIEKYKRQDSDSNILLLNAKNMGSGINLENTDIIIFFNKMSESIRTQVIGRALRVSRKKDHKLEIYNLCHFNEMPQ